MDIKSVPTVGGQKGIFDIFLPGAFVAIHVIGLIFALWKQPAVLPFSDMSKIAAGLAIFVCFAYFIGVLLRLLKSETADNLSGRLCVLLKIWPAGDAFLKEKLPFFSYLDYSTKNMLPPDTGTFYRAFWEPRIRKGGNKQFFNFCKTIINSIDPASRAEIFAAEALSRYVAIMFYAVVISIFLVLFAAFVLCSWFSALIAAVYLLACLVILLNLKYLRFKEAEMVFVATYLAHCRGDWPCMAGTRDN